MSNRDRIDMWWVKKRSVCLQWAFFIAALVGCLSLSGCVSLQVPAASAHYQVISAQKRNKKLNAIMRWRLSGALSIRANKKVDLANYTWVQQGPSHYDIRLSSALNLYNIQILGQYKKVTLLKNGQFFAAAQGPEVLMKKTTGWYLPVSNLYYWVRGVAAPNASIAKVKYDRYGHLKTLVQAGWDINYASYKTVGQVDLPEVMTLRHDQMLVKIVMRQWQLL